MDLVKLIKVKLTERNLSPRQLSLEAGLSPGYVSKVLGGMSPSLGAFAALVEVLECSHDRKCWLWFVQQSLIGARVEN